jgi:YD repeat-containing protein
MIDASGNVTHLRLSDGSEFWLDAAGQVTHERRIDGTEYWYDAAGNMTHSRWGDDIDRDQEGDDEEEDE